MNGQNDKLKLLRKNINLQNFIKQIRKRKTYFLNSTINHLQQKDHKGKSENKERRRKMDWDEHRQ